MIRNIHTAAVIDGLLDTLASERFLRAPLCRNLVDELEAYGAAGAARYARALIVRLDAGSLSDAEIARGLARLRAMVAPPRGTIASSRRAPSSPAWPIPRSTPRVRT